MARQKVTDVNYNTVTRITLPKPGKPLVEAKIAVRESAVRDIRRKFKKESNFNPQQKRGLKSLVIRVKNG